MSAALVALLGLAVDVGIAPPGLRQAFAADVARAVEMTAAGRAAKRASEAQVRAVEARVEERQAALAALRKELERGSCGAACPERQRQYDAAADEINAMIDAEEERIAAEERAKLDPIAAELRAIVARQNAAHPEVLVLDAGELAPINLPPACDASAWLARAFERKKPDVLAPRPPCRVQRFALVDLTKLMQALAEAKQASARLDAFHQAKQAELDAAQRRLASMREGSPEYEKARLELAARFASDQREMKAREAVEARKMREKAVGVVTDLASTLPGTLFLDTGARAAGAKEAGAEASGVKDDPRGRDALEPRCDLSGWIVDLQKGAAKREDLAGLCPP